MLWLCPYRKARGLRQDRVVDDVIDIHWKVELSECSRRKVSAAIQGTFLRGADIDKKTQALLQLLEQHGDLDGALEVLRKACTGLERVDVRNERSFVFAYLRDYNPGLTADYRLVRRELQREAHLRSVNTQSAPPHCVEHKPCQGSPSSTKSSDHGVILPVVTGLKLPRCSN